MNGVVADPGLVRQVQQAATDPRGRVHATVPIACLITTQRAMEETFNSGRASDTPDAPVEVCLRDGSKGRFEIVDGHHRVAHAIRQGRTDVQVVIVPYVDDEPYEEPFYPFGGGAR